MFSFICFILFKPLPLRLQVYSALDAVSGESIAVKVVRLAHAPSLQREVEALTLLPPHPNVIRYLGTSRTPTKQVRRGGWCCEQ